MNPRSLPAVAGSRRFPLTACIRALALATVALGAARAQNLILNGDFDANAASFVEFPGYLGGANPSSVPDWSFTPGGNPGINGTDAPGTGSPFAPATNVPHFLLMQGDFSAEQTIATTLGGLYQFSFDAASRLGNQAGVSVFADNTAPASLVLDGFGTEFGWLSQAGFQRFAFGFTGAGTQTVRFTSSGVGDHTTDLDKVSVAAVPGAMPIADGTIFFTEKSGTVGYDFALTGSQQVIFQRAGAVTYTGDFATDGSGGTLHLKSFGRQAGTQQLTFSGGTLALQGKEFQVSGQNGGNVDSIADANLGRVTLHDTTLTSTSQIIVTRSALHLTGNSSVNIAGALLSGNAWNDFTLGGTSSVVTGGGVDFRNVASHLALDGGTLTTPSIWGNSSFGGASRTIFNGTRVIASGPSADFLKMSRDFDQGAHSAAAEIANGGAILDTNGHDVTIANDFANLPGHNGGLTKLGAGTLTLAAVAACNGPTVIDAGTLRLATPTTGVPDIAIANSGFETPDHGPGGWAYAPGGAAWGFSGAGSAQNGSPWFVPVAIEGLQGGFLQNQGSVINQVVTVGFGGQYTLSFAAVGRTQGAFSPNGLKIYIDGNLVDTVTSRELSKTEWRNFSIPIPLPAGNHTLAFTGWNDTNEADVSSVIDAISLTGGLTGGGVLGSTSAVSVAAGAIFDLGGNTAAIGSLAGAGTVTSSAAQLVTLMAGADATSGADFSGTLQDGAGTLVFNKIGGGIQTLSGSNTHTGGTVVTGGVLRVSNSAALSSVPLTIRANGVFWPAFSNAAANTISLPDAGTPAIFANTGTPTLTGLVVNGGLGGTLFLASSGRESGSHVLTFSGNSIVLGPKSLTVDGVIGGGNVDSIADADGQLTVLHNATLTSGAGITMRRAALQIAGASSVTIGGVLLSTDAWCDFMLQDTATVTATGGVDFRAVASQLALNGGTLVTPSIWGNTAFGGATRTIFNGTLVRVSADSADFLKMSLDFDQGAHSAAASVANGGALFDTNGHTVAIVNDLADLPGHAGPLVKSGAGTLTLSGALTYTGATVNNGGTLNVDSAIGSGGNVLLANTGVTHLRVSQTLASLDIAAGAVVDLGAAPPVPALLAVDGAQAVPEPGTLALLALGALGFFGKRRRP